MLQRDRAQTERLVSRKNFYVLCAGKTNNAHLAFVERLKGISQIEVYSPEFSDYLLVFCPIVSRVGTDISEAMLKIPGGKPAILVVMHQTFSPDRVAPSSRHVTNPNVFLTVDCLFYEHRLLKCNCNDSAWFEIQRSLGVSQEIISKCRQKLLIAVCVLFALLLFIWIIAEKKH